MQRLLSRLTYSNVVSSLCLVLVLGGGSALAATKLSKNSVGTKQLKSSAVTGPKIKAGAVNSEKVEDGSLTGADIKTSSLGTVPTADFARTATNAATAQSAATAKTADSATTAQSAETAKTAESAKTAQTATLATSANSAATAGSATTAQSAKTAESATKAKEAEALAGHTAFSVFIAEGEREVVKIGTTAVKLSCKPNEGGQEIGRMYVLPEGEEATLAVAGQPSEALTFSQEGTVFTTEAAAGTSSLQVGAEATVLGSNGSGFSISDPTIGFELNGQTTQCFFSGVVQQLTPLS